MNVTASGVLNENTALVFGIRNPLTFIFSSANPFDWYTNNQNYQSNILWGNSGEKGIYDPCPHNWHVPQNDTWDDFSTDTAPYYINGTNATTGVPNITAGRQYKNQVWYPAEGFRDRTTAMLNTVGSYGHCWSAGPSNMNAFYLHFTITSLTPSNSYYRAYGFSVRCVQE